MKKINLETIIQFIFLMMTIILLIFGLTSGKINKYIHPRFNFGLWLSIIILLLFVISLLLDRRPGRHNINYQHNLVYLVPIILVIIFQPNVNGKTDVVFANSATSAKNVERENSNKKQSTNETSNSEDTFNSDSGTEPETSTDNPYSNVDEYLQDTQIQQDTVNSENTPELQESNSVTDGSDAYQMNKVNGYYVIDDATFADWFMDLYDHLDDFVGEKYQFVAQVFPMEGLKENQFLAGRDFMVCCAADLAGYGLICDNDTGSELKENQWIIVSATISKCEYEDTEVPMLIDADIKKTKAPKVEYIYYNSY